MSSGGSFKKIPLIYPSINKSCKNILLINKEIKDTQLFTNSVNADTFPIIYSTSSSKTELLALLKTNFTTIDRIGICFISSLENPKNFLDCKPFFTNVGTGENLDFLIALIKEFGIKNIDFLACDTLNYSNWVNYYATLTKETTIIVGASNDRTGNIKYGGDWVMESTSENIELVYFTKGIEYYTYLLDTIPVWATTGNWPEGLVIHDGYMYVANNDDKTISKINLSDPSGDHISVWATIDDNPIGLAIDSSGYLFAALYNGIINKISLSDPSGDNNPWVEIYQPYGITIYEDYIYIAYSFYNKIGKISLTNPNIDYNNEWATTNEIPQYLTIYDGYIYVANFGGEGRTIGKISLTDPSGDNNQFWAYTNNITGIGIYDGYIYVADFFLNQIEKISLTDPSSSVILTSCGNNPNCILIDNLYLYVGNSNDNTISRFDLPLTGDVCFPAKTPIQTDQGIIAIEKINPKIHTINDKKIVYITKTVSKDEYLICFKKDSLGLNYPSADTTMSKEHKVLHKGTMKDAEELINENIYKVKYNGEILYNILMEDYSKIVVNNLICETLHPDNLIAKLYRGEKPVSKEKNIAKLYKYASKH